MHEGKRRKQKKMKAGCVSVDTGELQEYSLLGNQEIPKDAKDFTLAVENVVCSF